MGRKVAPNWNCEVSRQNLRLVVLVNTIRGSSRQKAIIFAVLHPEVVTVQSLRGFPNNSTRNLSFFQENVIERRGDGKPEDTSSLLLCP